LVDWNDEKAIELVHQMEQYSYARDIPGMSENRFMFQEDQVYSELAVMEALARFPESKYKQDLLWKLANIHAVLEKNDSDEWIINNLEEGLNTGKFSIEDLDTYLSQYGFEIEERYTIPNLFGDEEPIEVIVINTQHIYTDDGLLVALREISPHNYDLILMESIWGFHWDVLEISSYYDLNGNGIPEIFVVDGIIATSSDICDLYILEWQTDHFEVLTEDGLPIRGGRGCQHRYEGFSSIQYIPAQYEEEELTNDLIVLKSMYPKRGSKKYDWNGNYYELVFEDNSIIGFIYDKYHDREYRQISDEIERYLKGNSPIKEFSEWASPKEGPARDFLRFILGLTYAYQSDVNRTREIFTDLSKSPTDPNYPYISQAAQAFVNNYYADADIYKSCKEAIRIINEFRENDDSTGYPNDETIGLSGDYRDDIDYYCSPWDAIPLTMLIEAINPKETTRLPEIMKDAGVTGLLYTPFDLWNDGLEDWIIIADLPDRRGSEVILAVKSQEQWVGLFLDSLWPSPTWIDVEQIALPGFDHPVMLVRTAEDFYIFDIEIIDRKLSLNLLFSQWGDEHFLVNVDWIPEVKVFNYYKNNDDVSYEWESYYWDEVKLEFFEGVAAEDLILNQHRYEEAVKMLNIDLQTIQPYYQQAKAASENGYRDFFDTVSITRAHYLYLLGLAYELNGDKTLAIQTYYQLWHEHPDSAYALMARDKLEPVK